MSIFIIGNLTKQVFSSFYRRKVYWTAPDDDVLRAKDIPRSGQ